MLRFVWRRLLGMDGGPGSGGPSNITLNVPSGSSHDFWLLDRNGITSLAAQADADFDLKTSFDAPPGVDTVHGFIMGDANLLTNGQFIRFDVYNQGTPTLFAASETGTVFHNGALTVGHTWLRIKRTGDDFDIYSGTDGTSWTFQSTFFVLTTVAQLGVWAGNFNTNPAHTVTFTPVELA